MSNKPNKGIAVYCDYEDADEEQVGVMESIITANGGEVTGRWGGEDEAEYRIGFRYTTAAEYDRIEAEGEESGWSVHMR